MDLLRIIVCLPNSLILDVAQNWYLGTIVCKIVAFIEAFEIFVSELTLSYIAYDRWQCLQNPFKTSNSTSIQKPKIIIVLVWTLAAVLALPEPFMSNVIPSSESSQEPRNHSTVMYTTCARDWSRETDAFYVIIKVIFSFCCPLTFMIVIYSKVIRHIWKHKALTPSYFFYGSTSRGRFNEPLPIRNLNRQWMHRYRRRKQTIKMLIAMTVVYNLGYFPFYIVTVVRFFVVFHDEKLGRTMKMMSHWFCYSTAAIIPIIYGLMSVRFREEFTYMCKNPASYCCFCLPKRATNTREKIEKHKTYPVDNIDKPLMPSSDDKFEEPIAESIQKHKDLVSTLSDISQLTHKTLSPMTSGTSTSTNCTRSTNLSSDIERQYIMENSQAIPEEEIHEGNMRQIKDIEVPEIKSNTSTKQLGKIASDKSSRNEIQDDNRNSCESHSKEIVEALVHHSSVCDYTSTRDSQNRVASLALSTSLQVLPNRHTTEKIGSRKSKSCSILPKLT